MASVLIGLIVLAAILLSLLVLAQNAKGGIGGQLGGSGVSQAIGVKKGADLLEKLTWAFAAFLMVGCVFANILLSSPTEEVEETTNSNFEAAKSNPSVPLETAPVAPAEEE